MSGTSRHDVKLAASSDAKDKMYEPKHKKKLVRVLTVVAYVFSVSLAAITLSLFYIFIYNPDRPAGRHVPKEHIYNPSAPSSHEDDRIINRTWEGPEEPRALPVQIAEPPPLREQETAHLTSNEADGSWDEPEGYNRLRKRSVRDVIKLLKISQVT